jgi:hypothetical protein
MYRILAVAVSIGLAAASVAGPALAAPQNSAAHSQTRGIASFVHSLLDFRRNPGGGFPVPPVVHVPPAQAFIGVCNILKKDWLVSACRSGFPGGGMSPG